MAFNFIVAIERCHLSKNIWGLAVAAATIFSPAAFAQDNEPGETVTITAPLLVYRREQTQRRNGMHILTLYAEQIIGYHDLDLSRAEDATKLRDRINASAARLCKRLEAKYPPSVYVPVTNQDCVKATLASVQPVVEEIIAAR